MNDATIKVSDLRKLLKDLPRYDIENPFYFIDTESDTGDNAIYHCHDVESAIEDLIYRATP